VMVEIWIYGTRDFRAITTAVLNTLDCVPQLQMDRGP